MKCALLAKTFQISSKQTCHTTEAGATSGPQSSLMSRKMFDIYVSVVISAFHMFPVPFFFQGHIFSQLSTAIRGPSLPWPV